MSPNTMSASRPLDGLERAFWLLDQNHPTHFVVTGEVSGATTVDAWRRALSDIGHRLPQLARQIALVDNVASFIPAAPRAIPLHVVSGGLDDWTSHVEEELATRFDTNQDPLVRARLLHEADRTVLLLVLHHSIGDGASAVALLRDVLRTFAGMAVEPAADLRALEQAVEDAGWEGVAIPDLFTDGRTAPPGYRPANRKEAFFAARVMAVDALARLRARAREESTTLHGALSAAAARAFAALAPPMAHAPRVFSPIDARRRLLGGAEHLGVHVNALTVRLDAMASDFWADARAYSSALGRFNGAGVLTGGIQAVRDAVSGVTGPRDMADGWAYVYGAEILLTNLGNLHMPTSFGGLTLRALWGPAVSTGIAGEQTLSALGLDGRLHLTHTSFEPLEGFLDTVIDTLDRSVHG